MRSTRGSSRVARRPVNGPQHEIIAAGRTGGDAGCCQIPSSRPRRIGSFDRAAVLAPAFTPRSSCPDTVARGPFTGFLDIKEAKVEVVCCERLAWTRGTMIRMRATKPARSALRSTYRQTHKKMLVFLDREWLEPPLIDWFCARCLMKCMPTLRVSDCQPTEVIGEVTLRAGPKDEVPMIRHHTVAQDAHRHTAARLFERPQKTLSNLPRYERSFDGPRRD